MKKKNLAKTKSFLFGKIKNYLKKRNNNNKKFHIQICMHKFPYHKIFLHQLSAGIIASLKDASINNKIFGAIYEIIGLQEHLILTSELLEFL